MAERSKPDEGRLPRRTLLAGAASTAAVSAGTWVWLKQRGLALDEPDAPFLPASPPQPFSPSGNTFDPRAARTLEALVVRLMPGSKPLGLPPADQAGVMPYLSKNCRLPGLQPLRRELIKLSRYLDKAAGKLREKRTTSFAELDDAEAMQILLTASTDAARTGSFTAPQALEACLRLCIEAYLSHPHHGGNANFVAWDALNIPMPRDRKPMGHGT